MAKMDRSARRTSWGRLPPYPDPIGGLEWANVPSSNSDVQGQPASRPPVPANSPSRTPAKTDNRGWGCSG